MPASLPQVTSRNPSAAERALWRTIMRNVRRLDRSIIEPPDPDPELARSVPPAPLVRASPSTPAASAKPPVSLPQTFDHETEKRLQKNGVAIDARLDLHGKTAAEAHNVLVEFIERSIARRLRIVLVITGKGNMGTGLLRRSLPQWLEAFPPSLRYKITAIRPALHRHGGDGAWYVMLKRPERKSP